MIYRIIFSVIGYFNNLKIDNGYYLEVGLQYELEI